MGHFERKMLGRRAFEEGREAFREGKSEDDCPYKVSDWGAGHYWLSGFDHERGNPKTSVFD